MRLIAHCDRGMRDVFRGWWGRGRRGVSTGLDCVPDCGSSKKKLCLCLITKKILLCQTSSDSQLQKKKKRPQIKEQEKNPPHNPQNSIKRNMYQNIISHLSPRNKSKRIRNDCVCVCVGGGGAADESADKITSVVSVLQVGDKLKAG